MVRVMAPTVIGGTAFYTEVDFARAYPGAKGREPQKCDIGIDFGADLLLVEVRGKSLSVEARVEGATERFKDDTDRLVIGEARQVHETARRFLADEGRLTGAPPVPRRRVVPAVVVGGG